MNPSHHSITRRHFLAGAAGTAAALAASRSVRAQAPTYKACVIGDSTAGGYGHDLHRLWKLRGDIACVGLADPDPEGRAQHAAEAGAERTYADYDTMLEKEQPDLVAVGPRWSIHHQAYLEACAEAGAHGIMEKPLAVDLAQADTMIDAVEADNLKWAIAFNFRASPVIAELKRRLDEEDFLGDILEIRSRGKEDHRAGGEDLIVLGIHLFDLMHYFFDAPTTATGYALTEGRPSTPAGVHEATEPLGPIVGEHIHASYTFPGGFLGYFSSMKNRHGNGGRWGMEIRGSQGIATIRMDRIPRVFYLDDPSWEPGRENRDWKALHDEVSIEPGGSPVWHYRYIVDDLIASIEENRRPAISLHDGRLATEMIHAVWASHIRGRTPVSIPLEHRQHPLDRWREQTEAR